MAYVPVGVDDNNLLPTAVMTKLPNGLIPAPQPSGLGWDNTVLNFTIFVPAEYGEAGEVSVSPTAAFDLFSTARTAPVNTYYVSPTGNDGNNGTTSGTAVASISRAVQLANAAGAPALIYVAEGTYPRAQNPAYLAQPTVDIAFIAVGRVNTGTFDQFSAPSLDATYTSCYSYTLTNVARVHDRVNLDRFGNYRELTKVATAAACNALPGSWALESGKIYIRRHDDTAVTNANTRVYRTSATCVLLNAHTNIFFGGQNPGDGWDFEGGSGATFQATIGSATSAVKALVVDNSTMKYCGGLGNSASGVAIESWGGLSYFHRCRSDGAMTDGFNAHNVQGSAKVHFLTVNCSGYDNGRPPNVSCNGWTTHENVIGIDVCGDYRDSHGGAAAVVNSSKFFLAGTRLVGDQGDISLGGAGVIHPTAVYVRDTAEGWLFHCDPDMPAGARAYTALSAGSKIHTRDCKRVRQAPAGIGTVDTY
ncbi:glycoside hydrolase [Gordonia phage Malisha]|nr:glycoside hydrolase [Gordonia phage Malisha]